ncbi:MAG: protein kinase domain-containing protein [Bradymonadia bacterium]
MKAQFGRYVFVKKLAVGGMAEIFLARRLSFGGFAKFVVIKRLLPEHKGRPAYEKLFLTEARIGALLNHPHIVNVYDLGKLDDMYFMAMEYVDGLNAAELMTRAARRQKAIPLGVSLGVVAATAHALDFSHHTPALDGSPLSVIHNDVSPQNIELSFDGDVKLLDFGVATQQGHKAPGGRRGKFGYMSPEAILREPISHQSDLFSLGVVLYEMVCGRRLFKGHNGEQAMARAKTNMVPRPSEVRPDISGRLEEIILDQLHLDPTCRAPRGRMLAESLESLAEELGCDMSPEAIRAFLHDLDSEAITQRRAELAALAEATDKKRRRSKKARPAEAAPQAAPEIGLEEPELTQDTETEQALEAANQDAEAIDDPSKAALPIDQSKPPSVPTKPPETPKAPPSAPAAAGPPPPPSKTSETPGITTSGEFAQDVFTGMYDIPTEANKPEEDAWDTQSSQGSAPPPPPQAPAPPQSKTPWLIMAAGIVVAAAGAFFVGQKTTQSATQSVATSGTLMVTSDPEGAHVYDGDTLLGLTPLKKSNLPFGKPLKLKIDKEGHTPWNTSVTLDKKDPQQRVVVRLSPAP